MSCKSSFPLEFRAIISQSITLLRDPYFMTPNNFREKANFIWQVADDTLRSAGRVFGASGTPSAVLVDAKGRVASELGVGASAVLMLAGVKSD